MHPEKSVAKTASTIEQAMLYSVRVIVAGSRDYQDYGFFSRSMDEYVRRLGNTSVIFISGMANGPDKMIVEYCKDRDLPWTEMPALWDDLTVPGAVIKLNRFGKEYNVNAGFYRNEKMAKIATHLVAWWDGFSNGTANMLTLAKKYQLQILPILINTKV